MACGHGNLLTLGCCTSWHQLAPAGPRWVKQPVKTLMLERPTVTPPDPRAAHVALTRLVHDPIMDNYPINYKDPPTCDDYPIELGREVDPANRHPGVGYWLNDPFGGHYFPFSIPN